MNCGFFLFLEQKALYFNGLRYSNSVAKTCNLQKICYICKKHFKKTLSFLVFMSFILSILFPPRKKFYCDPFFNLKMRRKLF